MTARFLLLRFIFGGTYTSASQQDGRVKIIEIVSRASCQTVQIFPAEQVSNINHQNSRACKIDSGSGEAQDYGISELPRELDDIRKSTKARMK